ncbi:B3 domain-containing protein Os03g0120900 isoform X3 [Brachypodium distachyon]|uniref:B3 domain-containing protein Os03g0120900 isoform X3 n=1 Tax=Brachypodium distachyon TaxID=15368 RepID=UPI00071E2757|nr:B3 domain-containing protein Os03g0120900 isoform X3 [Brachypodium distachyon]|eukprot:XP_014754866.1 B3 domain-containing protein Os03g0120900 isoform X3 [Brachypodium distachyon]
MEEEGKGRHRFFKVLVGDFARRLEIPRDFLCHIPDVGGRRSDTSVASSAQVMLKHSKWKTWPVELEKVDRRVFMTTGWSRFVEDNSLREYEFLLFRYDMDLHFMVSVFGRNACEKAIRYSGSGAQATGNLEAKLRSDICPSNRRGHSADKLTEIANGLMHSHSLVKTPDQFDTEGFADLHLHEVGGSKDELRTCLLLKGPMEDDKAKTMTEVMRRLHLDKVTIELFCAILCLYKWNVDAAAEDFDICRGKPQTQNQFLKKKLVLQCKICWPPLMSLLQWNSSLDEPNLLSEPLQCDQSAVKRKLVDDHVLCDLSCKQKRRIGKSRTQQTSETPRRSPRLARLNISHDSIESLLKERPEVLESSPTSTIDRVEDRAGQARLLNKKPGSVLQGDCKNMIGSFPQDCKRLKSARGDMVPSEEPAHSEETFEEQINRNALETSESLIRTGVMESSPPTNSKVSAPLKMNELYLTWKPSLHANPIEKILLDIQRDNFLKTISHVQEIVRSHPSDLLCADVIETVVKKEILKWDSCLEDMDAKRIVIAFLEHAKKIKEIHNFNMKIRKEEFSEKLRDQFKWQLNELESGYTNLELDYKKATSDSNIAVSTLEELKKRLQLHTLLDEIKDMQQSLTTKEDEMQKLVHQVAEHESLVQKSLMERVRVKTVLKNYEQILVGLKNRLASAELGVIDVEALVTVEMDNMSKEIEISKGSLLHINFK